MAPFPPPTDPRLLTRVLEGVATGVRRPRALAERLEVEGRRVQAAVDAAHWLGLLDDPHELVLTADGLAFAYAGRERGAVWSNIVRRHPVLGPLVPEAGPLESERLYAWVARAEPGLSAAQVRRVARGVRRLVQPALRARRPQPPPRQLALEFRSSLVPARRRVDLRAGPDESPDVYLRVLVTLLDHGELTLPQLRAVLDAEGGESCALGGYVAMALRRGDALRVGDALVVTRGAVNRGALAESPVTVALSDPDFRAHLGVALDGRPVEDTRFAPWMRRLFRGGDALADLPRLLFGRPLASVAVAGDPEAPIAPSSRPFLEVATRRGLAVAVPSALVGLRAGLAAVNRTLRAIATEPSGARLPTALDPRRLVHGGLLAPGEPPPRGIPDTLSLRLRAITNVPAFALLAALGLLERRRALSWRARPARVTVGRGVVEVGPLLRRLARSRDWVWVEGPASLGWEAAVELAVDLGVLVEVGGRLTLDEVLFHRLQEDLEHRAAWDALQPLAELLLDRLANPFDR